MRSLNTSISSEFPLWKLLVPDRCNISMLYHISLSVIILTPKNIQVFPQTLVTGFKSHPKFPISLYWISRNFRGVFIFTNFASYISNVKIKTHEIYSLRSSMTKKFVPPMTRKYTTALSVMQSCWIWKICHCALGNHNDDLNMGWRQISQQTSLLGEKSFI